MSQKEETFLDVAGMSCPSCIRQIEQALRDVDGVSGVEVRLEAGQVVVQHANKASVNDLVEALRGAGYQSAPRGGA